MTINLLDIKAKTNGTKSGLPNEMIDNLESTIAAITDELFEVTKAIHARPEIAWQERFAHKTCTDYMESKGWQVTRHAYGLETAWEAVYEVGQGGPVVGYNSEMDSLKGIGHACGHNLIAIGGMAAAIATARLLESTKTAGKVILLGTPAEEVHGGKCYLLQRGAYKEMEACLMIHSHSRGQGVQFMTTPCIAAFSIEYTGATAHAGNCPDKGINALDAAVSAYTSIAMLRQQLPSSHRVTIIIKGSEGFISNTIPNKASIWVGVRAPNGKETHSAVERIINCLKAGALASGCSYEIAREHMYMDTQASRMFEEYFAEAMVGRRGEEYKIDRAPIFAGTDFGNVSYHMPTLHPLFYLPDLPEGDICHSETYASHTNTRSATVAAMTAATGIAILGSRMIFDRTWAKEVISDWQEQLKRIDGFETRLKIEKLFESYPLGKEVSAAVCGCK